MNKNLDGESLLNLRNAIIVKACEDYRRALKAGDLRKLEEIKFFFKSDYFERIAPHVDADYIIEKLNKEFEENRQKKSKRYVDNHNRRKP